MHGMGKSLLTLLVYEKLTWFCMLNLKLYRNYKSRYNRSTDI